MAERQVVRLRFRRSAQRNRRNLLVCKCGNPSSLSIIPLLQTTHSQTHTHTSRHMKQYAEHVPSNSTRLSRRCMDATPMPQTHKYIQVEAHTQLQACGCKYEITQLYLIHPDAHTHTYLLSIILFIPLLQQMQVAEQGSTTTTESHGASPFLFFKHTILLTFLQ